MIRLFTSDGATDELLAVSRPIEPSERKESSRCGDHPHRPELPPGYSVDVQPGAAPWTVFAGNYRVCARASSKEAARAAWADFAECLPEWAAYLDSVAKPSERGGL